MPSGTYALPSVTPDPSNPATCGVPTVGTVTFGADGLPTDIAACPDTCVTCVRTPVSAAGCTSGVHISDCGGNPLSHGYYDFSFTEETLTFAYESTGPCRYTIVGSRR